MASTKRAKSPHRKPKNFVLIPAFVRPDQKEALKKLSAASRISQQAHLREALDDLFSKHSASLKPKASSKP